MNAAYFRLLADYGYWARDRLLRAADGLSEAEYTAPNGFVYGSLRGILVHALAAENVWLERIQGRSPAMLSAEDVPTLNSLVRRWRDEEARWRSYLAGLTDAGLEQPLAYTTTTRAEDRRHVWQVLAHLANHGTHHRSEAAEALTRIGRSPGDLDMIVYFREGRGDRLT